MKVLEKMMFIQTRTCAHTDALSLYIRAHDIHTHSQKYLGYKHLKWIHQTVVEIKIRSLNS